MGKYVVEGMNRLSGEVEIHGAKNAALPILAAALLCDQCEIHNCPDLSDVTAAQNILEFLGCKTKREKDVLTISTGDTSCLIPEYLMREMRSSIVFLGAIIAKCKEARISFPGGCELGPRPIDLHLSALQKLGVEITEDHGFLSCKVKDKLRGATIALPFPSVGATENIMLAACLAEGTTIIHNAAREPEINDLAGFLNSCGAKIKVGFDATVVIEGVEKLGSTVYSVIPDRIVTATYLCCGAITAGEILLRKAEPQHLQAILPVLEEMGCYLSTNKDEIYLRADQRLRAVKSVRTMPYPGFPTDAQAPVMALTTVAKGTSVFVENIFENRFKHAGEMMRMGADIKLEGRVAVVQGVDRLHSATVCSTDLRGGASLVVAALAAEGKTEITQIQHILRGYEQIEQNLHKLGAKITLQP